MTKKTAITAGAALLLLAGGGMLAMNKAGQKADAEKSADVANSGKSTAAPSGTLAPVDAEEKAARTKPRDAAQNSEFVAKYGESRTNLSKHVSAQVISLLEDAVAMGEMATSGEMGNAFGGPRQGLRMGLGGLHDKLQLTDEQQEKASEIYKDYQKRELAKSKEAIERLKKDPTALMGMMLASDAHTRKEMTDEEYKQLQTASEKDLEGTINPLDRNNFRGGQPLKDETFQGEMKAVLDPAQAETFDTAITEQAAEPEQDRSLSAMPSMELEKLDQTVTAAKKLTTGLKSMMEGMGGLQDLGPLMEQQRKAREAQRAAEQGTPAE